MDVEKTLIAEWDEDQGDPDRPVTFLSMVMLPFEYLRYLVMPDPLRYIWWLFWSTVRAVYDRYHRTMVLKGEAQLSHRSAHLVNRPTDHRLDICDLDVLRLRCLGAELDCWLAKGKPVSLAMTLRRFNHKVSPWEDAMYRYRLIKVCSSSLARHFCTGNLLSL